jgi:TonB-linked SusC/RagA family outer membrane protein
MKNKLKLLLNIIHVFSTDKIEVRKNHLNSKNLLILALFSTLSFCVPSNLFAQKSNSADKVISGVVNEEKGEPIPGVTVLVKGTSIGTITDLNGAYSVKVPSGSTTLVFSFIGMKKQEIAISDSRVVNVIMKSEELGLDEVVVVGYGTQKKETATGAISTVKSEDILKSSVSNVGNALVGLVPGISSVQFSGEPGSNDATIRIRGVSTLNGEGQDALVVIDGLQQDISVLNGINPNDIASVSVLKDASATSIYGIRGANGVIIVTTKRGKSGKPTISISSDFGFTEAKTLFKPVNSYEYALFRNEAIINDDDIDITSPLYFTEDELWKFQNNRDYTDAELEAMNLTPDQLAAAKASPALYYGSHDYFKDQYGGKAPQTEINLNVSGGNDKVNYFTSVGYFKQDGIINYDYYNTDLNSHYNRYNFRSNVDIKSIKNLTLSFNVSARFSTTSGAGVNNQDDDDRYWSINQWVLEASPFQGPGIRDGKLINGFVSTENPIKDTKGANGSAPLNTIFGQTIGTKSTSNVNTTLNLKYDMNYITKGLSVGSVLSYDDTYTKGSNVGTPVPRYSAMRNPENPAEILYFGGAVGPVGKEDNIKNFKTRTYYAEARISYDRQFGDHALSAVIIGNVQKKFDPNLQYLVPEGLMGVASRATYNFKETYLAEVNMAYNGSENFPESNRFGFFPSVSLGWVISNEPFLKDSKLLSWLKVRASYGIVGNDKIGGQRFLYLPSTWANYGVSDQILEGYFFGTTNGSAPNPYYVGSYEDKLGNPVVTWEKAIKRNISLETRFFSDKLSMTLELYNENRTDILWDLGVVPEITGAKFPAANIGEVYNKGYELELGWKDHIGKFNYFVKGYLAYAKNKIVYKDEAPYKYDWMNDTGYSIGQYKGYKNIGFFNNNEEVNNRPYTSANGNKIQPGDLRYVDVNGDGVITASDRVPIGYSNLPLYSFSSTIGFSYKGFDISALFTGSAKGSITFQSENLSTPFFKEHGQAMQWQYDGRWTPEKVAAGITPTFPRAAFNNSSNNNGSSLSDFWMRPNDYIKLKNIEMGYSFQELATKLKLSKIRISLSANNVWLIKSSVIDGIDPEQLDAGYSVRGFIFPMTSAYMAGINIEF